MSDVLVRNVADDVLKRLKARARQNRRSLQGEVRVILEHAAEGKVPSRRAVIDKVRALFKGRRFSDSAELIREDRER